ncbi:hypothetical protein EW146_g8630 [Bondarzewia mesenterica]|uniref:Uncharacterized protein n=1 Tax=Bondarzewia mesenterica TaxID=1095465 RepID=A0A4S4LDD9_9AGAM|nr:hypothetical protein EW146_g8630 [Bondarzewia mesenterica]
MASSKKSKAASTFLDLKAQIAKQEEEFAIRKAAGQAAAIVGGVKRSDTGKKVSKWARQNKGVDKRSARDVELEAISKPTLESARAALERKAKIYDKLTKGKSGGLTEKQYDALLVDFDSKVLAPSFESDSDDVDESLTVPAPLDYNDPIVEYEDEFGRARTAPRSEVPRHLLPSHMKDDATEDDDTGYVLENPVNFFPVYEPSADRIAAIEKAQAEETNPLSAHYDAAREVRAKAAGFYQFSGDEEAREKQMRELNAMREETEKTRQEMGAVDAKPGEVEGMRDGGSGTGSRASEKRKRELEERRKLLDAKRRKKMGKEEAVGSDVPAASPSSAVDDKSAAVSAPSDPFAALESKVVEEKGKGKAKPHNVGASEVDALLADIEQDLVKGRGR